MDALQHLALARRDLIATYQSNGSVKAYVGALAIQGIECLLDKHTPFTLYVTYVTRSVAVLMARDDVTFLELKSSIDTELGYVSENRTRWNNGSFKFIP